MSNLPFVQTVYVIRRKLDKLPLAVGMFVHSALLLQTTKNRWFVCEYGTEINKNKVCFYEVNALRVFPTWVYADGRVWKKPVYGTDVQPVGVHRVKEIMETIVSKRSYSMIFWNCHMAQKTTRMYLSLDAKNSNT
jgi:hypothetical protein